MDIDNINYPAPKQEYKVLVRCFTFNHSKYIVDALNGFAIQQTNFPFVCLVMDDASTDGEQEVIKAWMERECDMSRAETIDIPTSVVIIVPHKTNVSCTFAFYLLKQNLYRAGDKKLKHVFPWQDACKYEAMCEGDDYWIDPLKLQKQIDIADKDHNIGLIWCKAKKYIQQSGIFEGEVGRASKNIYSFLEANPVVSPTVLYKTSLFKEFHLIKDKKWQMGDFPFWLYIYGRQKVCFISDVVAVYRVLEESASHSKDLSKKISFLNSFFEIQKFYVSYYNLNIRVLKWYRFRYYYTLMKLYFTDRVYLRALTILMFLPILLVSGINGYLEIKQHKY